MQKLALLAIVSVVIIAGCVELPFGRQQVGGQGGMTAENPDISLQVSAFPIEVKGGHNISITWNITNEQPDVTLKDVNVDVYDQCLFSGNSTMHFNELRPGATKVWSWTWNSQETQFERDCSIKFKVTWNGTISMIQDINVLSNTEYYTREQSGKLSDLAGTLTTSQNPATLSLRFSDPLPWADNSTVYMYIDAADTGGGFIDKFSSGSVNITLPDNVMASCDGYKWVGVCFGPGLECGPFGDKPYECNEQTHCGWRPDGLLTLTLDRDLNFVSQHAPSLTCTFDTIATSPISTGTLSLSANYKYELDNSFTVKVTTK